MPVNKSFTPVSAKILAIISTLLAPAFCIIAMAAAVVFCRMLGSNPWLDSLTPVRFCSTESRYSSIGKDCPAIAGTVNGCTAPWDFIRTMLFGATVSKSSILTWPSMAVILGKLLRYILSKICLVIVDLISCTSIDLSAKLCPKNLCGIGIGQTLAKGIWSASSFSNI